MECLLFAANIRMIRVYGSLICLLETILFTHSQMVWWLQLGRIEIKDFGAADNAASYGSNRHGQLWWIPTRYGPTASGRCVWLGQRLLETQLLYSFYPFSLRLIELRLSEVFLSLHIYIFFTHCSSSWECQNSWSINV